MIAASLAVPDVFLHFVRPSVRPSVRRRRHFGSFGAGVGQFGSGGAPSLIPPSPLLRLLRQTVFSRHFHRTRDKEGIGDLCIEHRRVSVIQHHIHIHNPFTLRGFHPGTSRSSIDGPFSLFLFPHSHCTAIYIREVALATLISAPPTTTTAMHVTRSVSHFTLWEGGVHRPDADADVLSGVAKTRR